METDALYANYIERQKRDVEALKRDENQADSRKTLNMMPYIESLSNELKTKLSQARPSNLAQAGRINGMTPAALALLLATLRRVNKDGKSA